MPMFMRFAGVVCLVLPMPAPSSAIAQQASPVVVRCETFCSQETLRTATARLTWIDPDLRSGDRPAGLPPPANAPVPQIDVTVVKNGFNSNAYASFSTSQDGARAAMSPSAGASGRPPLRAYDLRVIGSVRPAMSGPMRLDEAVPGTERRETSFLVENLEPGLQYSWRLRIGSGPGAQLSAPAICVAPVCPADLKE